MLLKIYDKTHKLIGYIRKIRDLCIESSVEDGNETLSFTYLAQYHSLDTEYYVETADGEYVIKELSESSDGFPEFVAIQNREELWAKDYKSFSVKNSTIYDAARLACAGTGWTVHVPETDDPEYIGKIRNAGMLDVQNADDVLQKLCAAFMLEIRYDSKNKQVFFYEKRGEDRGVYFKDGLNLKRLTHKRDTYDLYTRIRPVGKDNLSIAKVNDGVEYLENKTYSTKNRTYVWDAGDDYTDAQALKDDAELMLADLAAPVDSFEADLIDLANQSSVYSVLSYQLGDRIRLIDSRTGVSVVRRIVRLTRYPDKSTKNTAEISSPILKFSDLSEKYKTAYDIINTVVSGDGRYTGTINVSDILHFEDGISGSSTISGINARLEQATLEIGTVKANYISAEQADLKYATIENLNVVNEKVVSIDGDYAKFKSTVTDELAAHTGQIDDLQVAKGWMLEGSIGDAQIASVSANKLLAGTIDTGLINILGTDGRLSIKDNTLIIKDDSHIRVQIGKDGGGDYSLTLWDAKGNLIWDALGVTENGIQRPIIRDDMVSENAGIQGSKLDIASVVSSINGGTTSLSTTIIRSGNKTLDVILQEQTQNISDFSEILTTYNARIEATENGLASKVGSQEYEDFQSGIYKRLDTVDSEITQATDSVKILVSDSSIEKFNKFLTYQAGTLVRAKTYTDTTCSVTCTSELQSEERYTAIASIDGIETGDAVELYQDDATVSDNKLGTFYYHKSLNRYYLPFSPHSETRMLIFKITPKTSGSIYTFNTVIVKSGDVYDKTEIGDLVSTRSHLLQSEFDVGINGIKSTVSNIQSGLKDAQGDIGDLRSYAETIETQTADKFSWLIKSGSNSTNFELTDRTAELLTSKFVVTDGKNRTIISGGTINLDYLFANNITATGTIEGATLIGSTITGAIGNFGGLYADSDKTYIHTKNNWLFFEVATYTQGDLKEALGRGVWAIMKPGYSRVDYSNYEPVDRIMKDANAYILLDHTDRLINSDGTVTGGDGYVEIYSTGNVNLRPAGWLMLSGQLGVAIYKKLSVTAAVYMRDDTNGFKISEGNVTCKKLTQTSDKRLKKHIGYMADNPDEYVGQLQQFRPAVYSFAGDNTRQYGLYAQDVRDSILESGTDPYGIVVANCADGTTGDMTVTPDKCTYAMDYTEVIPLLINGFQVHHSEIAELRERVSTLELLLQAAQEQLSTLQAASV